MKTACHFLFALCIYSCAPTPKDIEANAPDKGITIHNLQWLTGTWKSVKNNEISYEIWKKENDTLLTGQGCTLINNDTVFSEKLKIVQRGSDIFYVPAVKNQNNGTPVLFKFMQFDKGEFSFVNKDHDFPQRIIYKNPQPDFLCARIEGTKDGKLMKVDFNFLKVKD